MANNRPVKIGNVCQTYAGFSEGYDKATLALLRQGKAQTFGIPVTHTGVYIPAGDPNAMIENGMEYDFRNPSQGKNNGGYGHRGPDIPHPELKKKNRVTPF